MKSPEGNLQTFFDLDTDCNKQVYTNRRCYLSDCKVYSCHNTKCNHIVAKCLAYRKHDRMKMYIAEFASMKHPAIRKIMFTIRRKVN